MHFDIILCFWAHLDSCSLFWTHFRGADISRFHFSLPVCLDQCFCYYSSICIDARLVLFVVFVSSILVLTTCIQYITCTLIQGYVNRW